MAPSLKSAKAHFTPHYVSTPPGLVRAARLNWDALTPLLKRNQWLSLTPADAKTILGMQTTRPGTVANQLRAAVKEKHLPEHTVVTRRGPTVYVCLTERLAQ